MITRIKRQKLSYIVLLTCIAFVVLLFPSEKAEAQTYNAVWITGLEASPNPMLLGMESTTITINTLEYAQWFWLYPTTMTRPTVILNVAGRPFVANMTSEWLSGIGFWGWWFYWWFNQTGTWTHQVQWDGRDLQGNLVPPGSYLATVEVYAGAAYTFGSIVINVESPIDVKITSPANNSNIALNADTTFIAEVTPSQYANQIQWSGGGIPSTGTGGAFTTQFNTEGIKTITASVTAGSQSDTDSIQVNVLKLDYIKVNPLDAKVPVGRTYNFSAAGYNNGQNGITEDGGGDDIPIYITPLWSITNNIGTVNPVSCSQNTTFSAVSSLPLGVGKIKGQVIATAAGVSGFADVEVYEPRLAQVIVEPAEKIIRVGSSVTFATKIYDQENRLWDYGGLSYQWYINDIKIDGEISDVFTYAFNAEGKYLVKVEVSYKDQIKVGKSKIEVVDLFVESVTPAVEGIPETPAEETPISVTIKGFFNDPLNSVDFGPGIRINSFKLIDDSTIEASITVESTTYSGYRDVSVTIGDKTVVGKDLFIVADILITSCFSACVVGTKETILYANGERTTPVTATVMVGGKPLSNREVKFKILSGDGQLSSSTAITNADGQATVTLTAGTTTSKTVIKASVGTVGTAKTTVYMYNSFDFNTIISDADFTTTGANLDTQQEIEDWLKNKKSGLAKMEYNKKLISQIIYDASVDNGVSVEVILTTLQKEQSLISTQTPTQYQLNNAMGCPTSNIEDQIKCGAKTLAKSYTNAPVMPYIFPLYKNTDWNIQYVDSSDGTVSVRFGVTNAATYSLFRYTPWIRTFIDPADSGGNRLFNRIWSEYGF